MDARIGRRFAPSGKAMAPVFCGPAPLSDVDRLRRAMGDIPAGTVEKLADPASPLPKGTVRNVMRGTPLAKAANGKLLAWVEAFEAKAGL